MSPPAEDSDTPTVWRRRVSREPAAAASGARSFTLQECHERGGSAEVRLPPRLSPTPERAAPQGGPGGSSMGQMITLKAEDSHSFGAYRAAPGFESGYAPEDIDRGRAIRGKLDIIDMIKDIRAGVASLKGEGLKVC